MKKVVSFVLVTIFLASAGACERPPAHTCSSLPESAPLTETDETPFPISSEKENLIPVSPLCQYPELPTGCEAVAAVMVLQYYGESISSREFARNWLTCSEDFYTYDGKQYGPDPNLVFAGDPFSKNSYGCFAGAIAQAINKNSKSCRAEIITDHTLGQLCTKYIDQGKPLLIWATTGMKESSPGNSWFLNHNTPFTWIAGEHCLVLIGYNEQYYFLNDPMSGSTVAYQKHIVEKRFDELGNQALFISPLAPLP